MSTRDKRAGVDSRDQRQRTRGWAILTIAALVGASSSCKTIEGPAAGGPGGGTAGAPSRVVVEIVDFAFVGPDGSDVVLVSPGDTVLFINRDLAPHTATSTSWPGSISFDSGVLDKDDVWEFVAPGVGEWTYRCDFHPSQMQGARIVVAGSGGGGDPPPLDDGQQPPPADGGDRTTSGSNPTGSSPGATPSVVTIEMANSRFRTSNGTDTITIALGQTVQFVNNDNSSHTTTSRSGPTAFDSGRLREGQSYAWTPGSTGTWVYDCQYHPGTMSGAVIRVIDTGGGGATPPPGSGGGGSSPSIVPIRITSAGYAGPTGAPDVSISLGQTVQWVNDDVVTHELRSTDEPREAADFDSGGIGPGGSYRFTPDQTGVWEYKCRYHGDERDLRIIVN